jgi:hypothetical protein
MGAMGQASVKSAEYTAAQTKLLNAQVAKTLAEEALIKAKMGAVGSNGVDLETTKEFIKTTLEKCNTMDEVNEQIRLNPAVKAAFDNYSLLTTGKPWGAVKKDDSFFAQLKSSLFGTQPALIAVPQTGSTATGTVSGNPPLKPTVSPEAAAIGTTFGF